MKTDLYFMPDSGMMKKYFKKLNIKPLPMYSYISKDETEWGFYSNIDIENHMNCSLNMYKDYDNDALFVISEEIYRIVDSRTGDEVFRTPRSDLAEKELDILESRTEDEIIKIKHPTLGTLGNGIVYPYHPRFLTKDYIIDTNNLGDINIILDSNNNIVITGTLKVEMYEIYTVGDENNWEDIQNNISSSIEYVKLVIPNVFTSRKGAFRKINLYKYLDNIINKRGY